MCSVHRPDIAAADKRHSTRPPRPRDCPRPNDEGRRRVCSHPFAWGGSSCSTFGGPIIGNGGFNRTRAEAELAANQAELIAFGKPFISNPDLVRRFEQGAALAEPHAPTFYTAGAEGYADYPALAP